MLFLQNNIYPHDACATQLLCKIFDNFPGWHNMYETWWHEFWLIYLAHLHLLLYSTNRCKIHIIMNCTMVFVICKIICIWQYRLVLAPNEDIQFINIVWLHPLFWNLFIYWFLSLISHCDSAILPVHLILSQLKCTFELKC